MERSSCFTRGGLLYEMKVTQHVHQVPVATPTLFPATTTNVYVVADGDTAVLIDGGYGHASSYRRVIEYVEEIGSPKVLGILVTHFHPDHAPGARPLAEHFGCPIYAHPIEVPFLEKEIAPATVGGLLEDGDVFAVGSLQLQVLHAPGHTQGCLNFWLEEEGVLFTADNIVSVGTTWIGPPEGILRDYLTTLERLKTFPARLIAPGHGGMIADVREKIDFFIGRRLEREAQILGLLQASPRTEDELLREVYGDTVHPSVMWVAERTIRGHVIKLLDDGRIRDEQNRYHVV